MEWAPDGQPVVLAGTLLFKHGNGLVAARRVFDDGEENLHSLVFIVGCCPRFRHELYIYILEELNC